MGNSANESRPPVLVVLGPTASGKSRLAQAVALRTGGEILSVDALKVYRGMDAGTAKPTAAERAQVPHHGLDLVNASEEFAVAPFVDYANGVLADIAAKGKLAVLDATAPYYLKALIYGIERGPGPQPEFRKAMQERPAAELFSDLLARDPASAARIGPGDHKRLVRALEIIRFGDKLPSAAAKWTEARADYRWVMTGISWPRETLHQRVEARTRAMIDAGWLDEVLHIRDRGGFSRTAGLAHGYRRLQQHLDGVLSFGEAVELTIRDVRQFARKSMTFFRSFPKVQWLEVTSEEEIDRAGAYLANEMREFMTPTHPH